MSTTLAVAAQTGTGEAVVFWLLAPVMVIASIGMLVTRKAVHSALLLAMTMVLLGVLYFAQDAPFLGIVQIVVYTGAVMMLFLFVLMLVGVDASDSLVETLRGQRIGAVVLGIGFAVLLLAGIGRAVFEPNEGLARANEPGNVQAIAELLFTRYVLAFEVTSALLITAALGAMVLAHRERLDERKSQRQMSEERVRTNKHLPPLPSSGVYARHNAVDTPALLPDGSPSELSVSRTLRNRGAVRPAASLTDDTPPVDREVGEARTRQAVRDRNEVGMELTAGELPASDTAAFESPSAPAGEEPRR
jgi:NADH-quinone oxidoreductase subunit J